MKYATISAGSSGDNTVVSAVTGKKIRVTGYVLSFSGTVNAKWKSGSSTDLTGLLYGAAAANIDAGPTDYPPHGQRPGHFETARGEALVLNLSGATAVGGHLTYEEVS